MGIFGYQIVLKEISEDWEIITVKCCTKYANKFGTLSSGHRTGKGQFNSNPKERQCQRMFKLLHNCTHFTRQQSNAQNSPSQVQQYMNCELLDVQAGFRKGRGTRDQTASIHWIIKKAREKKQESSRKTSTSALSTTPKPLTVWITITVENSSRDGKARPPDLPPEKPVCRSGSNSQNWTCNNRRVPNRKRSTSRLYIVTLII